MPTLEAAIDAKKALIGARVFNRATRNIIGSAGRAAGSISLVAAAAVALGAVFVTVAARSIARFDDKMAELGAVTQATDGQLASLRDTAKQLGESTRFTVTEVATGLVGLARAGFDVAESNEAIAAALDLSIAGSIELGEATRITTRIMRAFGREAADITVITDTLTTTANSSNTTISELGQAMKFVGGLARQAGVPVQEMAAAIGVLADTGRPAGLAGRAVRAVIVSLIKPTPKATKAIEKLGLTVEDVNPEIVGFTQAFKNLRDANLDTAAASEIFTRGTIDSALNLAKNADAIEELTDKNFKNLGATEQMAEAMEKTLGGAARLLRSQLDLLGVEIGEQLEPTFRALALAARDTVVDIREFFRSAAGQANIEGFEIILNSLVDTLGFLKSAFITTRAALREFVIAVGESTGALNELQVAGIRTVLAEEKVGIAAEATTQKIIRSQNQLNRLFSLAQFADELNPSRQRELIARLESRLGTIQSISGQIGAGEFTALEGIRDKAAIALGSQIDGVNTLVQLQDVLIAKEIDLQTAIVRVMAAREASMEFAKAEAIERRLAMEEAARAAQDAEEAFRRTNQIAETFGRSVGNALEAIVVDGAKARDAFRLLVEDIVRGLFRILVTEQLVKSLTGAFSFSTSAPSGPARTDPSVSAHGQKGMIMNRRFQRGGLINQRTTFATTGGGTATTGEGGRPEAVLPLETGPDGRLGVASRGGGVTVIVNTPDADSFRRSLPQVGEAVRRRLRV